MNVAEQSVDERGGIVEVGKDAVKEKASSVKDGAVNVFTRLSGKNSREKEKRDELDNAVENIKKEQEEREKARKKQEQEEQTQNGQTQNQDNKLRNEATTEEVKETNKKEEENTNETIKTKTTEIEETKEVINEDDENLGKSGEGAAEPIVVGMGRGASPELLKRFKEELKAVLSDDKEKLNKWADEVQKKLDSFKGKIDSKKAQEMEDFFSKNWRDKSKIQDYINSFKDGSIEKDYANTLNEAFKLVDIDNESQLSKEEKIKSLVDSYNAKGLEIPPTIVTKMTDSSEVDRLVTEDQAKENSRNEVKTETVETVVEKEESSTKPVLDAINNDALVSTVSALGSLGLKLSNDIKIEGRAEGSIETEIENKIQEDFENRISETAAKYKLEDNANLLKIRNKMSRKAREELNSYEAKEIDENDLSDEAKSFAILEREAKYLGYKAEKGNSSISGRTTIESRFEDGSVHQSVGDTAEKATNDAIKNLATRRAEIEAKRNEQTNRRRA